LCGASLAPEAGSDQEFAAGDARPVARAWIVCGIGIDLKEMTVSTSYFLTKNIS
jgi:hypothetical protein